MPHKIDDDTLACEDGDVMSVVTVAGRRYLYKTAGEGFPLLCTLGPQGTIAEWDAILPLLGELCRTIVYEPREIEPPGNQLTSHAARMMATGDVTALLDALGVERVYLAAAGAAAPLGLSLALHVPQYVEALVLVASLPGHAMWHVSPDPNATQPEQMQGTLMTERLSEITIPVLILVGDQEPVQLRQAELLAQHLPQGKHIILPSAGPIPHLEQPRQLGHAMLDFLMHCERQRNLVRGASFLL